MKPFADTITILNNTISQLCLNIEFKHSKLNMLVESLVTTKY
jgi:hypothetical protein